MFRPSITRPLSSPPRRRGFERALRVRLMACLAALWVLFGAPFAHAVTRVPMCGEHAQTVIAPPISRPASDASLRAVPCEKSASSGFVTGSPERQQESAGVPELVPRVLPIYYRLFPRPSVPMPIPSAERGDRAGHPSTLDRPPR
jgi:hypothetical protein